MADNKVTKSAGEHWVCSVLSGLGWAAALTRDGLERTDVLAVHPDGSQIAVQVKTTRATSSPRFMMGAKGCTPSISRGEWYVLVALGGLAWENPRAFVVPRDHVAAAVWIEHMEWLTNPTVPDGRRNTPLNSARTSALVFARYEQRWDLLDFPTDEVPVLLPPRFRVLARHERVLLRDDHPWNAGIPEWETSHPDPSWSDWLSTET